MNTELLILFLSVGWGFFQLFAAGAAATGQRGVHWNLSSRDDVLPPLTGRAGRIDRAFQNFKETFPYFLAVIFLVTSLGRSGNLSAVSAIVYLAARIIYFPLYVFDVTVVRTVVWFLGTLGIAGILIQLFI